ncbi:hypothetical protein GDO86_006907 [Hymenochirus boettgeri]|uniref:Hexosyltransferase n=1 Tax=Hymenochirus boettgeri TaxID=247094 RepID=A0A8T2J820_9PIPI|nr:hypothetical protein GDO86_006907 [Hymenochirus boettgeri]
MNKTCKTFKRPKAIYLLVIFLVSVIFFGYNNYKNSHKRTIIYVPFSHPPFNTTPLYPYHIEERSKCIGRPPFLVLLIPSLPEDVVIRDTIRKTWANESLVPGISINRLFLLGMPSNNQTQMAVEQESSVFHDIIQQDFLDTYNNLTLKTLMGIEWVSRICPQVKYVMKVDSDMFFNPWFLVRHILEPGKPDKLGFFTGLLVKGSRPRRDKGSKWYISKLQYPKSVYPPYCSGTGYVFSGELSPIIYKEAMEINMFPYEDVFIGMCLDRIGVELSKPAGNWFEGEWIQYDRCQFAKLVTVHHYSSEDLLTLWPDFLKAVEQC